MLPDGSRSLIPAGWTDLAAMPVAEPAAATENDRHHSLARLVDFLRARTILDALLSRVPSPRPSLVASPHSNLCPPGLSLELMPAMLAGAGHAHRLIARSRGEVLRHFGHVTVAPSSHRSPVCDTGCSGTAGASSGSFWILAARSGVDG